MALGTVTGNYNNTRQVCLLAAVAATNGQPALATDGVPMYKTPDEKLTGPDKGIAVPGKQPSEASIMVKAVGTGTVSMTLRLWGYLAALGEWVPVGTGADTTKGTLNAGTAIGETKADKALHSEPILYLGHFDRLYLEVVAISGTGTAITAYVVVPVEEN